MDRKSRAVHRLWGPLGDKGRLHGSPRFAKELAARCDGELDRFAPGVSKWSFGQQLEHLYMASHYVLDRLQEAMGGEQTSDHPSLWGHALMVGGYIPRGMFPTIPQLVPKAGTRETILPLKESLEARLVQLEWSLGEIHASPGRSPHPRMKHLLASQWLFFLDIHHRHHLRIMRDIVKAGGPNGGQTSSGAASPV